MDLNQQILNDLVSDVEPGTSGTPRLRPVLRSDDVPDDVLETSRPIAGDASGLSYFRLFNAFEKFRKRLHELDSMVDLERLLFVNAGSLQELVSKVNAQVAVPGGSAVFNWFLVEEAGSLYTAALKSYARCREKYARTVPPDSGKWRSLKPKKNAVRLPLSISGNLDYMRRLREVCGYER